MSRRIKAVLSRDPVMARLIEVVGPCRLEPQHRHAPFQSLVHAIAHQQLSGVVAGRILGRLCALYAPAAFPEPRALLATNAEQLRAVGFSHAKIRALHDLADKCLSGGVPDTAELQALADEAIIERLMQVRGVGRWTVEMLLMFQLGRPDVLPVDDFGVRNGFRLAYGLRRLPTPRALRSYGERWQPFRSAAAWYLWRAVDLAREERLPAPPRPAPRIAQQRPTTRSAPPRRRADPPPPRRRRRRDPR